MLINHRDQEIWETPKRSHHSKKTPSPSHYGCKRSDFRQLDSLTHVVVDQRFMTLASSAANTPHPHSSQVKTVRCGPVGFRGSESKLSMHLSIRATLIAQLVLWLRSSRATPKMLPYGRCAWFCSISR